MSPPVFHGPFGGRVFRSIPPVQVSTRLESRLTLAANRDSSFQTCALNLAEPQDGSQPKEAAKAVRKPITAKALVTRVLADSRPSAKAWDDVLQTQEVTPEVISDAVSILNDDKKYEVGVEAIQSAMRNNLAAAWMYDVLAMEMKLAKRPAKDIARVLESRIDFSAADIPQLLIAVALLSRSEAYDEAMRLCREVTELDPHSTDSWLLARSVADKSKTPEHRVWARCGILMHVWTDDSAAIHDEARKVITELAAELDAAGESSRAEAFRSQLSEASSVELMLILRWVGSADLDLKVTQPNGEVCSYRNRTTTDGARFTHDDPGSAKDGTASRFEQYVCRVASPGNYSAAVQFVLGKASGGIATLEVVQNAGTPEKSSTTHTIKLAREDVKIIVPVKGRLSP